MAAWIDSQTCPVCSAPGTWDTMRHEPWCAHFMRAVDETDGRQLVIETSCPRCGTIGEEQSVGDPYNPTMAARCASCGWEWETRRRVAD